MKALAYSIKPFDAADKANEHVLHFKWQGAAVKQNRCIIKTNDASMDVVYDKTVTSMKYEHIIDPAHSSYKLRNGKTYLVYIQVSTDGNTWSDMGVSGTLQCLSKPAFSFANVDSTIYVTSYAFELSYSQAENEPLESFEIDLYDTNFERVRTSGRRYVAEGTALQYTFTNLQNNTIYHAKATGMTLNGYELDTGYSMFTVIINYPSQFSYMEAENQPCYGGIKLRTNLVWVNHQLYDKDGNPLEDEDGTYINLLNNDRALDLTSDYIDYWGELKFNKDFSFSIICANLAVNESIMIAEPESDPPTTLQLIYREGRNGSPHYTGHFELIVSTNINGKKWNRIYVSNNLPYYLWGEYVQGLQKDAKGNYIDGNKKKTPLYSLEDMSGKIWSNVPDWNALDKWFGVHIRHLNNLYSVYCEPITKNG